MSACHGCGAELPPSYGTRPRKWCSDRCRKAQYAGACVDCGKPTNGSDGRANAPKRCAECQLRHQHDDRHWTPERVVAAIREFAERYGHPPRATEWNTSMARRWGHREWVERFYADGCWPNTATVMHECGSWNAAIEAAGFDPGRPGVYRDPERRYRIDATGRQQIADRYTRGDTARAIAADLAISRETVRRYLHAIGVPVRRGPTPILTEFDIERAKRLYAQGYTLRMLAVEFACSDATIWRALHKAGAQLRAPGCRPVAVAA